MRYVVGLALLLAACAPTVEGTELGGVARYNGATPGPAIQVANDHCQRYGRVARPTQVSHYTGQVVFSCDRS